MYTCMKKVKITKIAMSNKNNVSIFQTVFCWFKLPYLILCLTGVVQLVISQKQKLLFCIFKLILWKKFISQFIT